MGDADIRACIMAWFREHAGVVGGCVIRQEDIMPGREIVLACRNTRQADVVLRHGTGGVEGFEYRCPCGRIDVFNVE